MHESEVDAEVRRTMDKFTILRGNPIKCKLDATSVEDSRVELNTCPYTLHLCDKPVADMEAAMQKTTPHRKIAVIVHEILHVMGPSVEKAFGNNDTTKTSATETELKKFAGTGNEKKVDRLLADWKAISSGAPNADQLRDEIHQIMWDIEGEIKEAIK